ncbi:proton channel OTOP2-like [Spea bombifrons]|uniref:proton channel OTOP2-like n=1 Tax=Spea bombifrons TaxID=233779 RepID=UPI00234A2852|nr:proton channel OTOP2-like [Spea bombifrons]
MEREQHLSISTNLSEMQTIPLKTGSIEKWKKRGRLLSGLVGSNILLFSCTLVTCVFSKDVEIWETDMLVFLSIMLVLCITWMLFQMYFSWKKKDAILFKDCQAGPIWMRGGIVFFGIGTIVMDFLKIIQAVGYKDCEPPVKIIQPLLQVMFVIVQTYFLWMSCKDCVQIHINATRCGLMMLLTVNLAIWVIAVTEESRHHTVELQKYFDGNVTSTNDSHGYSGNMNHCECKSKCTFSPTSYYYLYPFNIEYNLFAAALIFIMWKNVGRRIDDNSTQHHGIGPGVLQHVPLLGLISGMSVLVIGLVMFIMYEVGRENTLKHWLSLSTFYFFHVVSLGLMSLANLVGIIIFRLDTRSMDNDKNPSRTLDMTLLLSATLAQYAISYYSMIAMVATNPTTLLSCLTLIYSLLMIVQHSLQNVFIIEGLHRLPPNHLVNSHGTSNTSCSHCQQEASLQVIICEAEDVHSITSVPRHPNHPQIQHMSRRATLTAHLKTHLKKRKTMKDIYLFLFLSNIIFWIMPAFGARIRFDTGLEVKFYGFTIWAIITNVCLPFGIFYRMHAAASLLELYSMS